MLVAALIVGSFVAYDAYLDRHVTLRFTNGTEPVPPLELTFYPEQLAFSSPSPPPAIGECQVGEHGEVVVGDSLVPGNGVVRYRGAGVGTGFVHVQLGQTPSPIQLRPPRTLSGRVGEPLGEALGRAPVLAVRLGERCLDELVLRLEFSSPPSSSYGRLADRLHLVGRGFRLHLVDVLRRWRAEVALRTARHRAQSQHRLRREWRRLVLGLRARAVAALSRAGAPLEHL